MTGVSPIPIIDDDSDLLHVRIFAANSPAEVCSTTQTAPEGTGTVSSRSHGGRTMEITYRRKGAFHRDLHSRVGAYFAETGLARRDDPRALRKTAVMLAWAGASYIGLVFVAATPAVTALLALSTALAAAGIPMALSHDGLHQATSRRQWLNATGGWAAILVGLNPVWWRYKHNVLHHGYTNIDGLDDDLDLHGLARFSPGQRWRPHHQWQWLYLWLFYPLLHLGMVFTADASFVLHSKIAGRRYTVPRRDRAAMLAGKAAGLTILFGLPLARHPWPVVAAVFLCCSALIGVMLSIVFQIEHMVAGLSRPTVDVDGAVDRDWATSQVEGAANVACGNRLLTWYTGGLNFHIEHHLFPRVSHVHYPALAPIVREVAAAHGLHYVELPTVRAGLRAHVEFLRALGARPVDVPGVVAARAA